jgi:hypothetical protein
MTIDKGRGLRATRDIKCGEAILIDRAIATSVTCEQDDFVTSFMVGNKVDKTATVKLKLALVNSTQRDGILSHIVGRLADGTKSKPLVPLSLLMRTLDCCPLLLPGHFDYLEDEGPKLSTETIHSTVSMNTHGASGGKDVWLDDSRLFALVSTMNHSSQSNCAFNRRIRKGEELCMKYHENEKIAAAHWKFSVS